MVGQARRAVAVYDGHRVALHVHLGGRPRPLDRVVVGVFVCIVVGDAQGCRARTDRRWIERNLEGGRPPGGDTRRRLRGHGEVCRVRAADRHAGRTREVQRRRARVADRVGAHNCSASDQRRPIIRVVGQARCAVAVYDGHRVALHVHLGRTLRSDGEGSWHRHTA